MFCTDAVFNRDDLFAVATGSLPARGEMIMEGKLDKSEYESGNEMER